MKTFEPILGKQVIYSIKGAIALAKRSKEKVKMVFNDIVLMIKPSDSPKAIEDRYFQKFVKKN